MSALDLRSLLALLHEREVCFVVIGGVAVAAHGYVRGTADLDLVADAVETELLGIPVRVCSLARLREMKEAQGRLEDKADLANLPESEE